MKSLLDEIRLKNDSQDETIAEILLNQTEILAKQKEQEEILAELLLGRAGGETQ